MFNKNSTYPSWHNVVRFVIGYNRYWVPAEIVELRLWLTFLVSKYHRASYALALAIVLISIVNRWHSSHVYTQLKPCMYHAYVGVAERKRG